VSRPKLRDAWQVVLLGEVRVTAGSGQQAAGRHGGLPLPGEVRMVATGSGQRADTEVCPYRTGEAGEIDS